MNSPGNNQRSKPLEAETTLVTAGRDTEAQKGFVNPPVVHGSTVLYPTADDLHARRGEFQYGRCGTPTTKALQQALMALEGPQCAGLAILRTARHPRDRFGSPCARRARHRRQYLGDPTVSPLAEAWRRHQHT